MGDIDLLMRVGKGDLSADSAEAKNGIDVDGICKLVSHADADVRAGAAMLLSNAAPSEKVAMCFSSLLRDPEPRVVAESLWALEDRPQIAAVNFSLVESCLANQDWKIRLPALTVLHNVAAQNGCSNTLDWSAIVKRAVSDDCEAVRAEAAAVLGQCELEQEEVAGIFKQLCSDESADVRRAAVSAARNTAFSFDRVFGIIELGLQDTSYDVRIEACRLAQSHAQAKIEFRETLQSLADSTDYELKTAASAVLSAD